MRETLRVHRPNLAKLFLERIGLDITPADICCTSKDLNLLYRLYPGLAGDRTAIGPSDDGKCQDWRKNPGWWREIVSKHG